MRAAQVDAHAQQLLHLPSVLMIVTVAVFVMLTLRSGESAVSRNVSSISKPSRDDISIGMHICDPVPPRAVPTRKMIVVLTGS